MESPEKFKAIVESIDKLSVLELHELIKVFEAKYDVSANVAVSVASSSEETDSDSASTVDVTLEEIGPNKIQVIKAIKELLELGLKEAKDFTDAAPKMIKEKVSQEEAKTIQEKFVEAGAKVSIK